MIHPRPAAKSVPCFGGNALRSAHGVALQGRAAGGLYKMREFEHTMSGAIRRSHGEERDLSEGRDAEFHSEAVAMNGSILRWGILYLGLLLWGCASNGQTRDFTFMPSGEMTFPEAQEARLYRKGLGQPHRVIGQVMILGRPDEGEESLEKRLLEEARKVGAQGVIVVETAQRVSKVGKTGVRNDLFGGASKKYRPYPEPVPIEKERISIRGLAIRFLEE